MLLKVSIPVDTGNRAVAEGRLGSTIERILRDLKPEAAYFSEDEGQRTGYIFFDMKDSSEVAAVVEPWFLAFNARLTLRPVMDAQDLAAGSPGFQAAVAAYGGSATA